MNQFLRKDAKNLDGISDSGPCKYMHEYCSNNHSTSKNSQTSMLTLQSSLYLC